MKTIKNLRQLKFLAISIFVLISFSSCQEDEAADIQNLNCDVNSIQANLKECNWKTGSTIGSASSNLKFNDDFTFVVTDSNGGEEASGEWSVVRDIDVYLQLNSNYTDFLGAWKVVECGDSFLEFTAPEGGFTKLEKVCDTVGGTEN